MSTYHPTPEAVERDADMLQNVLAWALHRLDQRDKAAQRRDRDEETTMGNCYQIRGEPRRQAT